MLTSRSYSLAGEYLKFPYQILFEPQISNAMVQPGMVVQTFLTSACACSCCSLAKPSLLSALALMSMGGFSSFA